MQSTVDSTLYPTAEFIMMLTRWYVKLFMCKCMFSPFLFLVAVSHIPYVLDVLWYHNNIIGSLTKERTHGHLFVLQLLYTALFLRLHCNSDHSFCCSILEYVTGCTSLTSANVGLSSKQVVSNEKELMQKWKVINNH